MTVTLDILLSAVYLAVGTALFVVAMILAVLFHYRITPQIPRIRHNNNWFPPAPINYVIPQQPPPAHFYPPVPPRPPTVDEYPGIIHGRDEEDVPGEMEIGVQEGSDGDAARARLPYIQLSPDVSHHSSAGATPHPGSNYPTAADLARYLVWLGLGTAGQQAPQPPSSLPAVVLGIPQFAQSPMTPITSMSAPPLSSTSSGTTSIFPTLPTFPSGMNPYESPRDLPLPRSQAVSQRQSSHYSGAKEGSIFQEGEGSLRDPSLRSQRSSTSMIETADRQSVKGQRQSEESMKDIEGRGSQGSIVEEENHLLHPYRQRRQYWATPRSGVRQWSSPRGSPSPSPVPSFPTPNTPPADHPDNHRAGPLPPVNR